MKIISTTALAHTVAALRKREGLTHAQLGELTGLSPSMITRLEREDFIPSSVQLQALSAILGFDFAEMIAEQREEPSFIALQRERLGEEDRKDFDRLIAMMLTLRQQLTLEERMNVRRREHNGDDEVLKYFWCSSRILLGFLFLRRRRIVFLAHPPL